MECLKANGVRKLEWELYHTFPFKVPFNRLWMRPKGLAFGHNASIDYPECSKPARVIYPIHRLFGRHSYLRAFAIPVSLDEEPSLSHKDHLSNATEHVQNDASEEFLPPQLNSDELKSILADSERSKLLRKLSEANQYNRFLKRQLQLKDDDLVNFKSELGVLELELQALVSLAEEVANSGVQLGSRKINGKYIASHLFSRLEAIHEKVSKQVEDVDSIIVEDVTLFWVGMAESVQVMGSFDGWTQVEEMSPEYTGLYTSFSTTLKLRPGRYEIKFLVDGQWQLSPELPTIGEGLLKNNLLLVSR